MSLFPSLEEGDLEEEEEGQPSLEQATSVAAGEEEEGQLGQGTAPTDQSSTSASTSQRKRKEVRERNVL